MIQFRSPVDGDRMRIMDWIACDEEHRENGMKPEFFYAENMLSMVLYDKDGPGIFVRVDPEPPTSVRIHIQFSPDRVRSAKTLLRGWPEFSQKVWNSGVSRMVFTSKSIKLIAFCRRAFGFERVGDSDEYQLEVQ